MIFYQPENLADLKKDKSESKKPLAFFNEGFLLFYQRFNLYDLVSLPIDNVMI